MNYQLIFLLIILGGFNLVLSYLTTNLTILLAKKYRIVDDPQQNPERKFQKKSIPLMGGLGFIFFSSIFSGLLWFLYKSIQDSSLLFISENLVNQLSFAKIFWIYLGGIIIFLAGILDDKYRFKSKVLFLPVSIGLAISVIGGGLKITSLSYPYDTLLPNINWIHYLFGYLWIGFCLSATKFLDGHDGMVASNSIVAFLTIVFVSLMPNVNQPIIAGIAIIWVTGLLGFLPWNLPDAKIYIGESGSILTGFIIGVLSIIAGAKIATASSVIGWFVFDFVFVIFIRLLKGKKILEGDREHWHFRLLDLGFNKWQVLAIVLSLVSVSAYLGIILKTDHKIYLPLGQAVILLIFFVWTEISAKSKQN